LAQDISPRSPGQSYRAAKALIIFLFVLFVAMLAASMLRGWNDTGRRAEEQAASGAQAVAINARWISELSRQALSRIDLALGPDIEGNVAATADLVREAVSQLPGNAKSYIVAANGQTLFSTDPEVKPIDVRDRPYFSELAEGAFWYVSPILVSRLNGTQIFVFSKRLQRQGQFAGAAIISFDVDMLRDIWASIGGEENSAVALVRNDGQLVARYPLADGPLDLSSHELFTQHLASGDRGAFITRSPDDHMWRIVGFQRVPGTELVAVTAIDRDAAYWIFQRNAFVLLLFAVPTALALALAIAWIFRLLRNDQQRERDLSTALEVNRMLVRDTHHRVKNNLQAVMSMVRMHALSDSLKTALQNRIAAMSAVHEHLYRLDQFSEVSAATLVPGIVGPLHAGYGSKVEIAYDIDELQVDHDHATPLALLISELVTNALKYAFPDDRKGRVTIRLKSNGETGARLVVADDGVGRQGETPAQPQGLGSRLIRAMLVQLGGDGRYVEGSAGTVFEAELKAGFAAAS
jgi:two-component sensor histidine kinase